MNEKEKMQAINISGISILSCIQSIQFIAKDLAEMETVACQSSDGYYSGLTNIVERMAEKIADELKSIIELSA